MSMRGGIAGAIVGVCLGVIVAALKGWNFRSSSYFWDWGNDEGWALDGEAWVVTICLAIIGCIVGDVIGSRLKIGK